MDFDNGLKAIQTDMTLLTTNQQKIDKNNLGVSMNFTKFATTFFLASNLAISPVSAQEGETVERNLNQAEQNINNVGENLQQAGEAFGNSIENTGQAAEQGLENTGEAIQRNYNQIEQQVEETAIEAKEDINSAATAAKEDMVETTAAIEERSNWGWLGLVGLLGLFGLAGNKKTTVVTEKYSPKENTTYPTTISR